MSDSQSRRSFLKTVLLAPTVASLTASRWLFAEGPKAATVNTTADKAKAALVDVARADTPKANGYDTMAKALKYVHKSEKADQKCVGCMHYVKAVDAAGKDIQVDVGGSKQGVGSCKLFEAGKGYVAANGWCMSWFKMPA
jgi:hypothetical protein